VINGNEKYEFWGFLPTFEILLMAFSLTPDNTYTPTA